MEVKTFTVQSEEAPPTPPPSKCPLAALFTGTILLSVLPSVRVFRDRVLARNEIGRRFIKFYYGKLRDWTVPLIIKSKTVKVIGLTFTIPLIPLVKLMVFEIER